VISLKIRGGDKRSVVQGARGASPRRAFAVRARSGRLQTSIRELQSLGTNSRSTSTPVVALLNCCVETFATTVRADSGAPTGC